MARLAGMGIWVGALLACSPSVLVKQRGETIILNPDSPNSFERCKFDCELEGKGPPKACVETQDEYRCFCTAKPKET